MRLDLLTCYAGAPNHYRPDRGSLYRISDHPARKALLQQLRSQNYTVLGVVCSGEPIMTKWKWAAMAYVPAKTFILNENGDYFWLDYSNWKVVRHFVLFRAGLAGAGAVRSLARLVMFPITLAYLLAFAGIVHFRRSRRLHT